MSDENNNGRTAPPPGGRQPLTLKPRGAGSVSAGTVKQSFSHGRSKTVVVETKRARTHLPGGGNLAAPSSAEKRLFEPRPAPAPAGAAAHPAAHLPALGRPPRRPGLDHHLSPGPALGPLRRGQLRPARAAARRPAPGPRRPWPAAPR